MSDENPNAFKLWINEKTVQKYFNNTGLSKNNIQTISANLQNLELRARVQLIAKELKEVLGEDYRKALKQLLAITRKQQLKGFELWPATEFIQLYGLNYIDESLEAMYELTPKFTAEFSIRPFINKHGDSIYDRLQDFKNDKSEHIRRWLTEGTRPRLPWGEKLHKAVKDPRRGLEILEHFKFDSSLYVRKSVANHLNDIAKDHPELVVKTLSRWKRLVPDDFKNEFRFISSRALRTLIKDGHKDALKFSGISFDKKNLKCSPLKLQNASLKMGESLEFSFSVKNFTNKKINYILDFVIYFKKANGKTSPKVFKLKTGVLAPAQQLDVLKKHKIKPITTRKYYSGEHKIAIKLNGQELTPTCFNLKV